MTSRCPSNPPPGGELCLSGPSPGISLAARGRQGYPVQACHLLLTTTAARSPCPAPLCSHCRHSVPGTRAKSAGPNAKKQSSTPLLTDLKIPIISINKQWNLNRRAPLTWIEKRSAAAEGHEQGGLLPSRMATKANIPIIILDLGMPPTTCMSSRELCCT